MVHSLLQLSERWPCHIWPVYRMKFATHEANFGWEWGLLLNPLLLSLPPSGRSPESDITEILLTGTLNLKYQEP